MNNDLINREALLKAMEEERQYLLARGQTGAEHIIVHHCLPIIDNAPTVKPIIDPSFITDLDAVKDWIICGYRVEDLVKLSRILRDRRIEDVDLRDYNDCFFNGYRKAYDEIHNSIKKMTDDLIEANNKFKGVEDN